VTNPFWPSVPAGSEISTLAWKGYLSGLFTSHTGVHDGFGFGGIGFGGFFGFAIAMVITSAAKFSPNCLTPGKLFPLRTLVGDSGA
jgi:hypothetical protein